MLYDPWCFDFESTPYQCNKHPLRPYEHFLHDHAAFNVIHGTRIVGQSMDRKSLNSEPVALLSQRCKSC
jgi:hypothetical protein